MKTDIETLMTTTDLKLEKLSGISLENRRKFIISTPERNEAETLKPVTITKVSWRKTLLSLKDGVVYKFSPNSLGYQSIIAMAYTLRKEGVADYVVNSEKRGSFIYICKVPL